MSVRAYRIIRIEYEEEPSFNLSRQPEFNNLVEYSDGMATVERAELIKFLKTKEGLALDPEQREQLQKDIDATPDDYIEYMTW